MSAQPAAIPDAVSVTMPYFEAWNRHDAAAIVACFRPDGTYTDPLAPAGLAGTAIGAYAAGLWDAFPDLSFSLEHVHACGATRLVAEWRMRGTNTASFQGLPPTGRTIDLPGVDVIELAGDWAVGGPPIDRVVGYFDSAVVPRQLGLNVNVQPTSVGPIQLGTSAWASGGKKVKPGAYTITMLEATSREAVDEVRRLSIATVSDMYRMQGFLEWTGVIVGTRMLTITAWEHPEDSKQLHRSEVHTQASRAYYSSDIAHGGSFAWLRPEQFLVTLRCTACGSMVRNADQSRRCSCGAPLPDAALPW
jgi:steroid delta-isomerase-like uncharacterized protein